jgi:hypothetical protein
MLIFNLPQKINPTTVSKGRPDAENIEIREPEPRFKRKTFRNYMAEETRLSNEPIMGYDKFGDLYINKVISSSRNDSFNQMAKNNSLIGLINGKRRGEF